LPACRNTRGILSADQKALALGAQDCHPEASGAHTGDISAEMLADAGASFVIVDHSERRANHGETDALVRQKAEAVWRGRLDRHRLHRRDPDATRRRQTLDICGGQLSGSLPDGATAANLVVAYEPV
jgi:triosephosphate isomerase